MASVMMALGDFRFSMDTAAYQSMTDTAAYRWVAQQRVGRNPAMQFLGPGERKVELPGVIYPHFRGGLGQVDRMRTMAGAGEPLIMVDGYGTVHGKWCIVEITERRSLLIKGGAPLKIEFSVSLLAYGED